MWLKENKEKVKKKKVNRDMLHMSTSGYSIRYSILIEVKFDFVICDVKFSKMNPLII